MRRHPRDVTHNPYRSGRAVRPFGLRRGSSTSTGTPRVIPDRPATPGGRRSSGSGDSSCPGRRFPVTVETPERSCITPEIETVEDFLTKSTLGFAGGSFLHVESSGVSFAEASEVNLGQSGREG